MGHAKFGHVEELPSKRYRAGYTHPLTGKRIRVTFARKGDANAWLRAEATDIARRQWRAPELRATTVGDLAPAYITRADLEQSTRDHYAHVWERHVEPVWADVLLGEARPADVRAWLEDLARTGVGPTARAHAYQLLRGIFRQAVRDELVDKSPCVIDGAGTAEQQRPAVALTWDQVLAAAAEMPARYRTLVLVAGSSGLRSGELRELRRHDVTDDGRTLDVSRQVYKGTVKRPKTAAGVRTVTLPAGVAGVLLAHLDEYTPAGRDALVFGTSTGTHLAVNNLGTMWRRACTTAGIPVVPWHSLRHSAATFAAEQGATTKELMRRIGHRSTPAAMRYQHAARDRDKVIADRLDDVLVIPPAGARAATGPSPR